MHCQDRIHGAWCICCSQCCKQSSWSGLCMSNPSPLHRLATQHFDGCYKSKQSESILSQPEHIIGVSRHITLRIQYLDLGVFIWRQYIIIESYKDFLMLESFWLCTSLLTRTYSCFSCTYLLKFCLHKRLFTDEVIQWW